MERRKFLKSISLGIAALLLTPTKFVSLFTPKPFIMFGYWYRTPEKGWLWHEEKVKMSKDGKFHLIIPNNNKTVSRYGLHAYTTKTNVRELRDVRRRLMIRNLK